MRCFQGDVCWASPPPPALHLQRRTQWQAALSGGECLPVGGFPSPALNVPLSRGVQGAPSAPSVLEPLRSPSAKVWEPAVPPPSSFAPPPPCVLVNLGPGSIRPRGGEMIWRRGACRRSVQDHRGRRCADRPALKKVPRCKMRHTHTLPGRRCARGCSHSWQLELWSARTRWQGLSSWLLLPLPSFPSAADCPVTSTGTPCPSTRTPSSRAKSTSSQVMQLHRARTEGGWRGLALPCGAHK